jgi:hypothetical protein
MHRVRAALTHRLPSDRLRKRRRAGVGRIPLDWRRRQRIPDRRRLRPAQSAAGSRYLRERVHFLGIVSEETFEREELQYFIRFYHNPSLFTSEDDAHSVLRTFPPFQPGKTRNRRPDLFVHEVFEVQDAMIQFGTVIDGAITICHAHCDLLGDLLRHGLTAGSRQMVDAFHRHEGLLRRLSLEKAARNMTERDGTIFLLPKDLGLLESEDGRVQPRPATVRSRP